MSRSGCQLLGRHTWKIVTDGNDWPVSVTCTEWDCRITVGFLPPTSYEATVEALREHAQQTERLISEFHPPYSVEPERALDTTGRPILLEAHLRLAEVYAALAKLEAVDG